MSVNTNKETIYDAFISYRHSELDKFVAEELHKQLETFKIPKKIAAKCGKKRISRIFRDKDELPISSNLADPILNALSTSEFLIVICSPRLNESLWCKREIENFIAMHGQEKVLAVLIEGEPSESFPQELLYREKTVTGENGEITTIKEPVEPLAADVRGTTKKEVKKHIQTEILRLLAPMLGCNYDDLKQRHKERKMHRILAIASVVGCVGLTFGTVSTIMALQIKSQKEQIDEQYVEIKEQKEQIDKQYWEALQTNAKMSSEKALDLLAVGDRIQAMSMVRELLPEDLNSQEIPYTPEAFYALSESLYPYAVGDVLRPVFQIKANAEISDIMLSRGGDRISILTKYGQMTVWDVPNKQKCLDVNINQLSDYSVYSDDITFAGDDRMALLSYGKILLMDLNNNAEGNISKEIEWDSQYRFARDIISSKNGEYLAVTFQEAVCIFDTNSGKMISAVPLSGDREVISENAFFYGTDSFIYCDEASEEKNADLCINRMNILTGEVISTFKVPYGRLAEVNAYNDMLYLAVNGASKDLTSLLDAPDDAKIYCFDMSNGKKVWEHEAKEEYINRIVLPYDGYDCFLFESYAQITALNKQTGEIMGIFDFGSSIVNIFPLQNPDNYIVYTRDGRYVTLIPEENYNVEIAGRFIPATDNIKEFEWGNNFMMSLPYSSKEAIVYGWYQDEDGKEILEFEDSVVKYVVREDGKYSAAELRNEELIIIDNEKNEIVGRTLYEEFSKSLCFVEDDKLQRISGGDVFIYDLEGNLISQTTLEGDYVFVDQASRDEKYAFADNFESLLVINCETGKVEKTLSKEQCNYGSNSTYVFGNGGDKCVILDKSKGQCRLYDVAQQTEIASVDVNATYIANVQFSENDTYVYIVYEDGLVQQYLSADMSLKSEVQGLNDITDVIYEKTVSGETKYYFETSGGTYILGEYDGVLKTEQYVPLMKGANVGKNQYLLISRQKLIAFPIYTYEEILGKAERICYDNSLWNN